MINLLLPINHFTTIPFFTSIDVSMIDHVMYGIREKLIQTRHIRFNTFIFINIAMRVYIKFIYSW